MTRRRIVITGIGLWTPLGTSRESTWQALLEGRSATRWLPESVWPGPTQLAGAPCERVAGADADDPVITLARQVAQESIADAGLSRDQLARNATGVVFGTSKGGLQSAVALLQSRAAPERWLDVWPNAAAVHMAAEIGCTGPVLAPVAACATGLIACQRAADLIRVGRCDVVLAGSADASLQPAILGSFQRLGVLSRAEPPETACRPFDRTRSGFVIGEGAGGLILESLEHAQARGARWYAEWIDGRQLSDPAGLTQLSPDAAPLMRLLSDLKESTGRAPDYINLHGTGTRLNDAVECRAIQAILGPATSIPCSSVKGALGHLLGAAGTVELAATILTLRDQIIPPTVNLFDRDPELNLNLTPQFARPGRIDHAWKLSLGFGGHLAASCVAKLE